MHIWYINILIFNAIYMRLLIMLHVKLTIPQLYIQQSS